MVRIPHLPHGHLGRDRLVRRVARPSRLVSCDAVSFSLLADASVSRVRSAEGVLVLYRGPVSHGLLLG